MKNTGSKYLQGSAEAHGLCSLSVCVQMERMVMSISSITHGMVQFSALCSIVFKNSV